MARLNYHHLYYFWRVASEGNLSQVAKAIPISQSALSAQIKQLEESIDTQLFSRDGRRLNLTDAGRRVLSYANDIFTRGEELEALLKRGVQPESQVLNIGVLNTLSRYFIDSLIRPLLDNPHVTVNLQSQTQNVLLEGLSRHQFDVALTDAEVRGSDEQIWQSQLLAREPVSIVGRPALQPAAEFPEGYKDAKWIVPTREHDIRSAFEGFCARWQLEPDIKAVSNDMAMLRLLALNSGALAVLPNVVIRDELRQGSLREFLRLPNVFEEFYAITIRRTFVPPALEEMLSQIDDSLLDL
ncbi:MAG: LysR family transcriptional regulator [Gammaproteobacteria bacterium]